MIAPIIIITILYLVIDCSIIVLDYKIEYLYQRFMIFEQLKEYV